MNSRITIERRNGKSVRSVTYRIDGLVAVHLTQRLTSPDSNYPKKPTISWPSAAQTSDLTYTEAFQECLSLACTVAAEWAAEQPAPLQPALFRQPIPLPEKVGGNMRLLQCMIP
jgi:hypothetical protein